MKNEIIPTTKSMTGSVVKLSSKNTVSVKVETRFPHPKYGKIVFSHKKYLVDYNEASTSIKVGDIVKIIPCAPVSKMKTWKIAEVIGNTVSEKI